MPIGEESRCRDNPSDACYSRHVSYSSVSYTHLDVYKRQDTYIATLKNGTALVIDVYVKGTNSTDGLKQAAALKKYLLSVNPSLLVSVVPILKSKSDSIIIRQV